MPGCAAYGCSNTNTKGFYMARFPRDPDRRALWIEAVNRPQLSLTSTPVLCEVHFDEGSWEKVRVDGTRKLKSNAVPTKFLPSSGVKRRDKLLIRKANEHYERLRTVSTAPITVEESDTTAAEDFTHEEPVLNDNNPLLTTDVDNYFGSCTTNYGLPGSSGSAQSSVANNHDLRSVTNAYQQKSTSSSPNLDNHYVCKRLLQKAKKINKLLIKTLKAARAENRRLRRSQVIVLKNIFNNDEVDTSAYRDLTLRNHTC